MIEDTNCFINVHKGNHKWRIPIYAEVEYRCIEKATIHDPAVWDMRITDLHHIGNDKTFREHDLLFDLVDSTIDFDRENFEVA